METKLIRTEDDLERAIARFEEIMFTSPGTREYGEMEVLGALIRDYEHQHFPIDLT